MLKQIVSGRFTHRDMRAPVFIHSFRENIPERSLFFSFFCIPFWLPYFCYCRRCRCCFCSFSILLISDFSTLSIYGWLLITIKDYSLFGCVARCVEWACVYAWVPKANTYTNTHAVAHIFTATHLWREREKNVKYNSNINTNRPNKQLK